jgi:hypothetical protein
MRRIIVLCALLTSFFALPALALPGIGAFYAGVGTHTYGGFPGQAGINYGGTLEAGIDSLAMTSFGLGLRLDMPTFSPVTTATNLELRYSFLTVPFVRLLGGVWAGFSKPEGFVGTYGVFGAARLSLGLPYVALNLGGQGVSDHFSAFGQLTVGVVL